jgi:hypothetical protein
MAIDVEKEPLIPIGVAARTWPGGSVSPETTWRWHARGLRGVRLETVVAGARRYTSRAAIRRFIAATTATANARLGTGRLPVSLPMATAVTAEVAEAAREDGRALQAMLERRRRGQAG